MTTRSAGYQLLVIDPCRDTQALITQQVEGRGYSVITASDLASALSLVESMSPDIIMTDLFLADGAGLTLLQELSARREFCPVIAMAREAPEQTIVDVLRAGAVDYLHKPITEAELAQVLQRAKDVVPGDLVGIPGVRGAEYRLSVESDPTHIPGIISWLIKTTASALPPIRQLQLRGALQELLFNAIEHGNLEISGQDKHEALMEGRYEQLVTERRSRAELSERSVMVHIRHDRTAGQLVFRITDEGHGFNWRTLFERRDEVRESEAANGRGIFLTHALFPTLAYNDQGNEVTLTVPLS